MPEEAPSLEQVEAERERELAQQRRAQKKAAPAKAVKGAAEKMALEAGKKYLLRLISGAFGVTGAGLIVTALIMNFQLFYGNILKGGQSGIALSIWEVMLVLMLDFLVVFLVVLAFVLFLLMLCIANAPVGTAWDIIWGNFPNRCVQ